VAILLPITVAGSSALMNAGSVWKAVINTVHIYHLSGSGPIRDIPVYGTPAPSAASRDTGDVFRTVIISKRNNEPDRESEMIFEK
jgi:hypothetical protein